MLIHIQTCVKGLKECELKIWSSETRYEQQILLIQIFACRYLTAAVSPNMEVANAILPAYVISMLYFVGLLLRVPSIPDYWRWFIWANPVKHWSKQMHCLHCIVWKDCMTFLGTDVSAV